MRNLVRHRFLSPFFVIQLRAIGERGFGMTLNGFALWLRAIGERGFGMTFYSVRGPLPDYFLELHRPASTRMMLRLTRVARRLHILQMELERVHGDEDFPEREGQ